MREEEEGAMEGPGQSRCRRARGAPGRDGRGAAHGAAEQGGISAESPDLCSFHICYLVCRARSTASFVEESGFGPALVIKKKKNPNLGYFFFCNVK